MAASSRPPDRLIEELQRHETDLQEWLHQSSINALWFAVDPVDAIRASGIAMPQDLLLELEQTLKTISEKIHGASAEKSTTKPTTRSSRKQRARASVA